MTAHAIKAKARELGFDACRLAPAAGHPELHVLREWLDRGYAGSMAYLERSSERRADVRRVVPSARTVIATATVYNTDRPYSTESADRSQAQIARYAWGDDYHEVIGARLAALLDWMRAT
jgi:epoxyqueuosine reductase